MMLTTGHALSQLQFAGQVEAKFSSLALDCFGPMDFATTRISK